MTPQNQRSADLVLLALACMATLFFLLPLLSLLITIPWNQIVGTLSHHDVWRALRLSLIVSISAVILAWVFGFPIAWVLVRYQSKLVQLLRILILTPMIMPPVVSGVVLLSAFGVRSPVGQLLNRCHIHLPFTTAGAILAVTFVSAPFMILSLEAGLRSIDPHLEEAAVNLGASRWTTLRTITLPTIAPAIISGTALTWVRALGEFGATISFAGNMPGKTQTLPLAIYQALQSDTDRALLLSAMFILIVIGLMMFFQSRSIVAHTTSTQ